MMIDTRPSARRRATRSRIIAPSLAPIAASGSSSRMMSASELTVRATAIAWRWPPDSRATGTSSRGTFTPIWSSAERASRLIARLARNGVRAMRRSRLRRWRLMSRRAVTGPKRLATCSTRSTSSAARASSGVTIRSSASGTAAPLPHASDVDVDDHRDEDRHAEDEVEVVGADALERQAVAQDAEEQRAEERPDRRALAAGEQRPADDRRRHGPEHRLRRARRVRRHRACAHRLEDADQSGEEAADDEVADHDEADVDARLGRAV